MSERVNGVLDRIKGKEGEVARKVDTRLPLLSIKSYGVEKTTVQLCVCCSEKKSGFDVMPGKVRGRKVSGERGWNQEARLTTAHSDMDALVIFVIVAIAKSRHRPASRWTLSMGGQGASFAPFRTFYALFVSASNLHSSKARLVGKIFTIVLDPNNMYNNILIGK